MAVTLTGSKYSGVVSSYSSRELSTTGASFVSGDFNISRIVALFNSSSEFKGIGFVRKQVSSSNLEMEYDFFEPVTNETVTPVSGDLFDVSNNLSELASTGLSVNSTEVVVSDSLIFGTSGNQRSLCLYDEEKDLRQTGGSAWELRGGVTVFGHLGDTSTLTSYLPVNIVFQSSSTRFKTANTAGHFVMYGGSVFAQSTPAYFGGYQGSGGGTLLLSGTKFSQIDLISVGAGGSWGGNKDRHILRNISHFINKLDAIATRWGDGVIEGGSLRMAGGISLAVFGTDSSGSYSILAPAGERLVVSEVGNGAAKSNLFRSSTTRTLDVTLTNVIASNRRFTAGSSGANIGASAIFRFKDNYSNSIVGTKIVINNDSGSLIDSGISDGSPLPLTVTQATIASGDVETVVDSAWEWGAYLYGYNIVSSTFTTSVFQTISGDSPNVVHGGLLSQTVDLSSKVSKFTADAYTEIETSAKFYDRAAAFLFDNYAGESAPIVLRSGIEIDAGSYNINVDATANTAFAYNGSTITIKASNFVGDLLTTGLITFSNGSTISGTYTDTNGTVAPSAQLTVKVNQTGCDVVILEAGTDNVLASVDAQSGTDFVFNFTGTFDVDIGVIKPGFQVNYTYGYSLTGNSAILPISLRVDRNYL